ncbi:hypothetical protein CK203_023368 [Vitis vinifera]|uniref:Uncharacterized protein n=1 Tax=Vitis vinifera TaxID=29760 RepID=A0A438J6V7_VITVI|nr:hypothetical protein CK203_023368 [Vitis vinifera]
MPASIGTCPAEPFCQLRITSLANYHKRYVMQHFYGELSEKWGQCHMLTSLNISNNNISGAIPPQLGKVIRLQQLDLSTNHLSGKIQKNRGLTISVQNSVLSLEDMVLFTRMSWHSGHHCQNVFHDYFGWATEYEKPAGDALKFNLPESLMCIKNCSSILRFINGDGKAKWASKWVVKMTG